MRRWKIDILKDGQSHMIAATGVGLTVDRRKTIIGELYAYSATLSKTPMSTKTLEAGGIKTNAAIMKWMRRSWRQNATKSVNERRNENASENANERRRENARKNDTITSPKLMTMMRNYRSPRHPSRHDDTTTTGTPGASNTATATSRHGAVTDIATSTRRKTRR